MNVHAVNGRADIQVDIHIHVVVPRQFKNAPDLASMVRIITRRAANDCGAVLQGRDNVCVGLRRVGPALLGKDTNFDIDGPTVVHRQLFQCLEPAQAHVGVQLYMGPHMAGSVDKALL